MSEVIEVLLRPNSIGDRFRVVIDEDEEPVDWDCAVARFLLSATGRDSPASIAAPVDQLTAAVSVWERREHTGLTVLPNKLHSPGDLILM